MSFIKLLMGVGILIQIYDVQSVGVQAACFRCEEDLPTETLRKFRAKVEPSLMSDVYQVVDKELQKRVRSNDLNKNMRAIGRLLLIEVGSKLPRTKRYWFGFGTRPLISEDFDKNITINALLRLNDLKKVYKNGLQCSMPYTHYITENNLIARDPIGRRLRAQPDLLPRLDDLIFDLARRRAEHCLPIYKQLLNEVFDLYCYDMVKNYWDSILEHRFRASFDGPMQVDVAFRDFPEQAMRLLAGGENAIVYEEMDIILDHLSKAAANSSFKVPYDGTDANIHKFDKFARTPCLNYIDATLDMFESVEFSMQFDPYLPRHLVRSFEEDNIVYRLQAYCIMCKKLVAERDRFVQLLNLYLIDSLPYRADE